MTRKTHAFTLIELLVVVTIIVILLALLTPAMDLLRSPGVYAWECVYPFPSPLSGGLRIRL